MFEIDFSSYFLNIDDHVPLINSDILHNDEEVCWMSYKPNAVHNILCPPPTTSTSDNTSQYNTRR